MNAQEITDEIYLKINSFSNPSDMNDVSREWIKKKILEGIKTYADYQVKRHLEKAYNNVRIATIPDMKFPFNLNGTGKLQKVDKDSITGIKIEV